jgi:hypothetical protein
MIWSQWPTCPLECESKMLCVLLKACHIK